MCSSLRIALLLHHCSVVGWSGHVGQGRVEEEEEEENDEEEVEVEEEGGW